MKAGPLRSFPRPGRDTPTTSSVFNPQCKWCYTLGYDFAEQGKWPRRQCFLSQNYSLAHSCSPGVLMPMISHFPLIGCSINSFIHISLGVLSTKHYAPCWKCQAEHCMFSKSAWSSRMRPPCVQAAGTVSLRSAATEIWTGHQSKQSRCRYDKWMVCLYHYELELRHSSKSLIAQYWTLPFLF